MKRTLLTLASLVALAIGTLWIPDEWLEIADAQEKDDVVSKATPLKGDLLKIPEKIKADGFTVAKTAPEVEIAYFAGLGDRGKGTLWSSWGDGCLHSNGKYYTSVGDHLGIDGSCHIYEYDPMTRVLRRVVDVLRAIGHKLGLYGHGKIHSGIHEAADGSLYFTTYWGKQREIDAAYTKGYEGSILLRFDPKSGKTENLGAIVPQQGLPASHFDPARQLLYFHAVYKKDIAVYDIKAKKVIFKGGADISTADRTFLAGPNGRVFLSGPEGTLAAFDPAMNKLVETKITLPPSLGSKKGSTLRAAAQRPAKDGTLYGMTAPGRIFAIDPKTETTKDLGPNFADGHYTAVTAISPDDKYLYYAPGAHGGNVSIGAPVVQFEIATGKQKVLAFLGDVLKKDSNYTLGGTYNLQLSPTGDKLYITFNGAPPGGRPNDSFGRPCIITLAIPRSER